MANIRSLSNAPAVGATTIALAIVPAGLTASPAQAFHICSDDPTIHCTIHSTQARLCR